MADRSSAVPQMGIQVRFTLYSLLFSLIPIGIIGVLAYFQAQTALYNQTGVNLEDVATAAGSKVERFLQERSTDIEAMAASSAIAGTGSQGSLDELLRQNPGFSSLMVVDTSGEIIATTDGSGGNQKWSDWFEAAAGGKTFVTDIQPGADQAYAITFAAPVTDSTGKIVGVFSGDVSTQALADVLKGLTAGENGTVILVDKQGRVVASSGSESVGDDLSASFPVQQAIQGSTGNVVDTISTDIPLAIYGYVPLSSSEPWTVIARLPLTELADPTSGLIVRLAILTGIAVLLVAGVIFFSTRQIVQPIQELTGVAEQLGTGNYRLTIPSYGKDEIGQLADSLRAMVRAVQKRDNDLQDANTVLIKSNRELAVARKQAEDANRLKSEFLATMSHELRTPLNAIIGYTEIQLEGMTGELNEEQQEYQKRILLNGEHLLQLINDILDLAKIEAGRTEIIKKPFNLKTMLDELTEQAQGLADEKGLKFTTILDDQLPEILIGDPARFKQIGLNLISNAIKFTERGGVVVELKSQGRDAWAMIVTDTGIGIPSHALEYIFDEFRQLDGTSQRSYGGTGLGLAIVRNLALMMGGNVRVKSQVGEGSSFTILLPLVTEELFARQQSEQLSTQA